jgi:hypothetical protein
LNFSGSFHKSYTSFWWGSQNALFQAVLDPSSQVGSFSPSNIKITITENGVSDYDNFDIGRWNNTMVDRSQQFRNFDFNKFTDPDSVEMRFSFPGTDYEYDVTWKNLQGQ